MSLIAGRFGRLLGLRDLRILIVVLVGVAVFGIVDGSGWRSPSTSTIAYRPAFLFGVALVFGWRGMVWSQIVIFAVFGAFTGWRAAIFLTPLFTASHALGLFAARRLARGWAWLSGERATIAFLAGAVLAPAVPSLLNSMTLRYIGLPVGHGVPTAVDLWLRGIAGILAIVPAMLVYGSKPLRRWAGLAPDAEWRPLVTRRHVLELLAEMGICAAILWMTVAFKEQFSLNVTYLAFLPSLAFILVRGMGFAALVLATNAVMATTMWQQLHWAAVVSAGDLRLLLASYSLTILIFAAVVDERERSRTEFENLVTAEAVLRENEKHFRIMANSAPVMIWATDQNYVCTFVNTRWLEFTGRTLEQELGDGWIVGIHPEDKSRCLAIIEQAAAARRGYSVECRFRRADGEYRWMLDNGMPLYRDGEYAGFIGSCTDITDAKAAAAQLMESEQRLKSAQELAHVGSWHWDLTTDRVSCSEEMRRILGQPDSYRPSLEALIEAIAPGDRERVGHEIQSGLAEKRGCSTEFQIVRPTGEFRSVVFVSRVLVDEVGIPRHVFGACQDVTDMRRSQEEAFSRQKLETLGTLANGIAHDFNNVLGGVVAQAELGLAELEDGSGVEGQFEAIRGIAMRGSEIVRELMIYAGTESQTLATVNLSKIVKEMMGLLRVSVSKHASIETELAADLPAILANSARISQLVLNLVTNASEAIGETQGVIRIRTWRAAGQSLRETGRSNDRCVQLEISDTGCGMSPETRARMFEPFFSTKSSGRGLGLAVVEGIVRSLDGTIELDSKPGNGTAIRVSLPSAEGTPARVDEMKERRAEPAKPHGAATILLVEDEDLLRQAISKMFRKAGMTVIEAATGSAAMDAIRAVQRIDIL
ncbi:MAG TPA: PAS domain S-box protein, partial [Terracidiphilus sp.]